MTVVLGCALSRGLLLTLSPFLWPARLGTKKRQSGLASQLRVRLAQAGMPSASVPAFGLYSAPIQPA